MDINHKHTIKGAEGGGYWLYDPHKMERFTRCRKCGALGYLKNADWLNSAYAEIRWRETAITIYANRTKVEQCN